MVITGDDNIHIGWYNLIEKYIYWRMRNILIMNNQIQTLLD